MLCAFSSSVHRRSYSGSPRPADGLARGMATARAIASGCRGRMILCSKMPLSRIDPLDRRAGAGGGWFFLFAHPGHELRVHHFLEQAAPTVAVLTDGSGSTGQPRLDESRELLA